MTAWCIGPWRQVDFAPGVKVWAGPSGTTTAIDFRPATSTDAGVGLFCTDGTDPGSDYVSLGSGSWTDIKSDARIISAFPKRSGVTLSAGDLLGLIRQSFSTGDPTGADFAKPLMPGRNGLEVLCGSLRHSLPFKWGDAGTNAIKSVIRRDIAAQIADAQAGRARDPQQYRRVLDALCIQYGVADWKEFVPVALQKDVPGRLPHATVIQENFNGADSSSVVGNQQTWSATYIGDSCQYGQGSGTVYNADPGDGFCRCEADLSSADHYSQITLTSFTAATGNFGPVLRASGSQPAVGYFTYLNYSSGVWQAQMLKALGTSGYNWTSLSGVTISAPSIPFLMKGTVSGSALELFFGGVSQTTATDTAITGNLRCGVFIYDLGAFPIGDNFECGDTGGGGGTKLSWWAWNTFGLAAGAT
jgi:hypothetical protein